ncbi:MAG: elongation factor P [Actinomycetota bacterium]
MVTSNDLKNGMVLEIEGNLWTIIWFQHHKPGKGGAVVRTKMRNVKTGAVVDRTLNAGVKVDQAIIDKRDMTYLYHDGSDWIFMDATSYEQLPIPETILGDATKYMVENQTVTVGIHDGKPITIDIPASVELTVTQTDPGVKGNTVTGAMKPATLETGAVVQVPLFVEQGSKIKVDTRTGEYLTRVS